LVPLAGRTTARLLSLIELFVRDPQGALAPDSRESVDLRVLQELVESEFASLIGFLPGSELNARLLDGKTRHGSKSLFANILNLLNPL
jgi:hypothetical protein